MNLIFNAVNPPSGVRNTTGGPRGPVLTDEQVAAGLTTQRSAKSDEKDTLVAELAAACAQASRDLANLLGNDGHERTIRDLVDRITRLEGEIEFIDQALSVLAPS
jgi:hypothetical protein